jgi:putative endonuclease
MKYYTYILRCKDNTLYTGITTDLKRRVSEHNGKGGLGAKYTKARRPVELIYQTKFDNRSEASKEEFRIKKMSRIEKESLIQ